MNRQDIQKNIVGHSRRALKLAETGNFKEAHKYGVLVINGLEKAGVFRAGSVSVDIYTDIFTATSPEVSGPVRVNLKGEAVLNSVQVQELAKARGLQ